MADGRWPKEKRTMKRSRYSEEQIAYALRQAESGTAVGDVCRTLGISEATFYVWKKKFANLGDGAARAAATARRER
jgi:putative transposase